MASQSRGSERREARRVRVSRDVRFVRSGLYAGDEVAAELQDVSTTGLRMISESPLVVGEVLEVHVEGDDDRYQLTGDVVWIERTLDGSWNIGCELRTELTRRQIDLLHLFLPVDCVR